MDPIQLFNQSSLFIQDCGAKGRGVVTRSMIPGRTLIDISPVLVFPSEEYSLHGQYTQLGHYTYRWSKGSMALALGLGSMFNHSNNPNVGFQRDFDHNLIRYTTLREIPPNEELCISYGLNLWFPDMEQPQKHSSEDTNTNGRAELRSMSPGSDQSELTDSEDETAESFLGRLQLSCAEDEK
ncbi:hypothetical protein EDD11_004460 [Mortierella claussenii]|nr:hypothetical protein EDD11_004460 [Mortierella claussenii]